MSSRRRSTRPNRNADSGTASSTEPPPEDSRVADNREVQLDDEVATLLVAVPEFSPRYLTMVEALDELPDPSDVFTELADFVSDLIRASGLTMGPLQRSLQALEAVATGSEDSEQLVAWAFLDSLSPDDLRALESLFYPATKKLLNEVVEHLA